MSELKASDLRAGDIVEFLPDGEEWVVLFAEDDRLMPAGWPISSVAVASCALRRKATDTEHSELLERVRKGMHPFRDAVLRIYGTATDAP
jgi:hypothetical protein